MERWRIKDCTIRWLTYANKWRTEMCFLVATTLSIKMLSITIRKRNTTVRITSLVERYLREATFARITLARSRPERERKIERERVSFTARWQVMFASVIHELCFTCSWTAPILDPIVWLDGARPANTYILLSFPWMAPAHHVWHTYHSKAPSPLKAAEWWVCCTVGGCHSREGGRDTAVSRSSSI